MIELVEKIECIDEETLLIAETTYILVYDSINSGSINHQLIGAAWLGDLQLAYSLVDRDACVNCCLSLVAIESHNYVMIQDAG